MVVEIIAPIGAAILAGIGWSTLGIFNKWRSNQGSEIDYSKLKKNVAIGAGLGIVTFGYAVSQGDTSVINTFNQFILAVSAYFPLIVIVDKILGRSEESDEE